MKFAESLEIKRLFVRRGWKSAPVFLWAFFLLSGAGCSIPIEWTDQISRPSTTTTAPAVSANWVEVDVGIARFDERVGTGDAAARLVIWRIQPEARLEWLLATSTAQSAPVSHWADADAADLFVLNAGYFHGDGLPSGWVQKEGKRWGKRQFDADKSGLILLGSKPRILPGTIDLSTIKVDAFQTYPWLIRNGNTAFSQETGQYARRTFVGIDKEGAWYVGVVPSESVTLYQLAQLLNRVPTKWEHVMNLDGGPSTGMIARVSGTEDRFDSFAPVSYVIVGKRRP